MGRIRFPTLPCERKQGKTQSKSREDAYDTGKAFAEPFVVNAANRVVGQWAFVQTVIGFRFREALVDGDPIEPIWIRVGKRADEKDEGDRK